METYLVVAVYHSKPLELLCWRYVVF
jgi:hypothetical protein